MKYIYIGVLFVLMAGYFHFSKAIFLGLVGLSIFCILYGLWKEKKDSLEDE